MREGEGEGGRGSDVVARTVVGIVTAGTFLGDPGLTVESCLLR